METRQCPTEMHILNRATRIPTLHFCCAAEGTKRSMARGLALQFCLGRTQKSENEGKGASMVCRPLGMPSSISSLGGSDPHRFPISQPAASHQVPGENTSRGAFCPEGSDPPRQLSLRGHLHTDPKCRVGHSDLDVSVSLMPWCRPLFCLPNKGKCIISNDFLAKHREENQIYYGRSLPPSVPAQLTQQKGLKRWQDLRSEFKAIGVGNVVGSSFSPVIQS